MPYRYINVEKVDSNNNKQKSDNSMFNKVVADVYKTIKYRKKNIWCYLPTKEHLDSLIERLNSDETPLIEIEYVIEKEYIKVRRK